MSVTYRTISVYRIYCMPEVCAPFSMQTLRKRSELCLPVPVGKTFGLVLGIRCHFLRYDEGRNLTEIVFITLAPVFEEAPNPQ